MNEIMQSNGPVVLSESNMSSFSDKKDWKKIEITDKKAGKSVKNYQSNNNSRKMLFVVFLLILTALLVSVFIFMRHYSYQNKDEKLLNNKEQDKNKGGFETKLNGSEHKIDKNPQRKIIQRTTTLFLTTKPQ